MTASHLYLDHAASTPVHSDVREAMAHALRDAPGNPSSPHGPGRDARRRVETARVEVAAFLGARACDIVFTGSGTESCNLALRGMVRGRRAHVVVSATEHAAVLETATALRAEGVTVTHVAPTGDGRITAEAIVAALRDETILVSVHAANNETGVISDARAIAAALANHPARLHTDAVHLAGRAPIDVDAMSVDLLSISAHKLYGPKGAGALWIRPGVEMRSLLHGGGQERGLRPGTPDVVGIVGMGVACRLAGGELSGRVTHLTELGRRFETLLRELRPDVVVHGMGVPRVPGTTCLSVPGADSETWVTALDLEGIAVSAGAACTTGSFTPSHVLRAMGVVEPLIRGTLRISFGRGNTEADVDRLVAALVRTAPRLGAGAAP